jgi:hypothetical protein
MRISGIFPSRMCGEIYPNVRGEDPGYQTSVSAVLIPGNQKRKESPDWFDGVRADDLATNNGAADWVRRAVVRCGQNCNVSCGGLRALAPLT